MIAHTLLGSYGSRTATSAVATSMAFARSAPDMPSMPTRISSSGRTVRRMARTCFFGAETLVRSLVKGPGSANIRERVSVASAMAANLTALHGIHVVERGVRPDEACVFVANHVSYVEPLAILAANPCIGIAKREVGAWPILGEATRACGTVYVDRGDANSGARALRNAWHALRAGVSVLVFPEGTTTDGHEVLGFRSGAFGLARIAGVPIQPVAVGYPSDHAAWYGDEAFVPHYARLVAAPSTRVELEYLPIVAPASDRSEDSAVAEHVRAAIVRALGRRRPTPVA